MGVAAGAVRRSARNELVSLAEQVQDICEKSVCFTDKYLRIKLERPNGSHIHARFKDGP